MPDAERRRTDVRATIEGIKAFRRGMPRLSAAEIRTLIEEGRNGATARTVAGHPLRWTGPDRVEPERVR